MFMTNVRTLGFGLNEDDPLLCSYDNLLYLGGGLVLMEVTLSILQQRNHQMVMRIVLG